MDTKTPVLITGARAPVALHAARLLTEAGHPVTLVDHLKYPVAAASQLGITYRRIPSFSADAEAASNALCDILKTQGVTHVIPTCEEVLHLSALWERQTPKARLFAPSLSLLSQVHNKYRFIRMCDDIGLPTPQTHLLTSPQELARHAATAQDLVFKPVWSRFASQVLIRPSRDKLSHIRPTAHAPWIAQEFVTGTELCVYAIARAGRIVALTAYRGVVRAGVGAAVCFAPETPETVRPFVEQVVKSTNWSGQISFDVMLREDGQIVPLECNPRATSGLHFFTDGAAFSQAIFTDEAEVQPDVTAPQTVRLALWLYGLRMMLRQSERPVFLAALRQSGDVMTWPGDHIGWPAQLRSVAEFAGIALRQGISLERASTWGIEWNGEDQSSIS